MLFFTGAGIAQRLNKADVLILPVVSKMPIYLYSKLVVRLVFISIQNFIEYLFYLIRLLMGTFSFII